MSKLKIGVISASILLALWAGIALAGNISTVAAEHYAWNDLVGWLNFYDVTNTTVNVGSANLIGYSTSLSGDLSLSCTYYRYQSAGAITNVCASAGNYKVLNDGVGNLSGWAWSDAYGWVSFCGGLNTASCPGSINYRVTINSSGVFSGFAWNDAIGWISFNGSDISKPWYLVKTLWAATSTSGYLDSSTFDLGMNGQLNSIMWQGVQPANTTVGFQLAATSSAAAATWTDAQWAAQFMGPQGCSAATDVFLVNPSVSATLFVNGACSSAGFTPFANVRYFRYRAYLTSDIAQTSTPQVGDVVVNWSP